MIDWTSLSPRRQATVRQIGSRLLEGYSPSEIATELGISLNSVRAALADLRAEIAEQAGRSNLTMGASLRSASDQLKQKSPPERAFPKKSG